MAINTALLVASPTLQDVIVDDATGLPLVNGQIFLYQDNSRTTFKNWYYQSGSPGAYTYITLPNPLTLNAAGAISDPNGNDTIPFFYPFSEADNVTPQPYYIQVFNAFGQQKFVRQNFPFNPDTPLPIMNNNLTNHIINGGFWRNVGSVNTATLVTNPLNNLPSVVLAPGANDNFSMPDIIYSKNVNDGSETITFNKFANAAFYNPSSSATPNQDVTYEYYMNLNVTNAGTSTSRYVQIPIQQHIKNLEQTQATFTLWAQNVSSNPNNKITIQVLQFLGTGATSPAASALAPAFALTNSWQKLVIPFTFPNVPSTALGGGGDDAWYIQIAFPVGGTSNINIAKPALYIGNSIPTNEFITYDKITPIIDGFRTGDMRTSTNSFVPFGWVSMNDGTIGSATSGATTRANIDTWPLYNLIWNNISKPTGNTFAAVTGGLGASAIADFATANKTMILPLALGRAFLGLPPATTFTYVNGTGIFTVASNTLFDQGSPVYMTNTGGAIPSGFALSTIYYAIPIAGSTTTLQVATSYANAIAGTAFIPASDNGSGTNSLNFALGGSFGEKQHTQLTAEVGAHVHPAASGSFYTNAVTSQIASGANFNISAQLNTGTNTPNSAPFNIVQPSTYMNIYIKL